MNHFPVLSVPSLLIVSLIVLYVPTPLSSQSLDKRARLEVEGRIQGLSVSPNGGMWILTDAPAMYRADSMTSLWHYTGSVDTNQYSSRFEKISFFNQDTAILTGYISWDFGGGKGVYSGNGFLRTTDGGRTWKNGGYHGGSGSEIAILPGGNAWIAANGFQYSEDFGETWRWKASPLGSHSSVSTLIMIDSLHGICAYREGGIYKTSSNWETWEKVVTPLDQGLIDSSQRRWSQARIDKIRIWNGLYVLNCDGSIFYSDTGAVDWLRFPGDLQDVETSPESNSLFGITRDRRAVRFSSPSRYEYVADEPFPGNPESMTVVDEAVYALIDGRSVARIDESGVLSSDFYTSDHVIPTPKITLQTGPINWGATGIDPVGWNRTRADLYATTNGGGEWYREQILEFDVVSLSSVDDSTVNIWNGSDNYHYAVGTDTLVPFLPRHPFASFLRNPISEVDVVFGSTGCFHWDSHHASGVVENDSLLRMSMIFTPQGTQRIGATVITADVRNLVTILKAISIDPAAGPKISDFRITEADIREYLQRVENRAEVRVDPEFEPPFNVDFFRRVPGVLDTLSDDLLMAILADTDPPECTSTSWYRVVIRNTIGDTILMRGAYDPCYSYGRYPSWGLPWTVEVGDVRFRTLSLPFSRYIDSLLPDGFYGTDIFSNALLQMRIGDFLYVEELRRRE